jgi:pyridoxamine 5'-phosphate oxidase
MTLATVGEDGLPDARTVLLKGVDEGGFVFYTNLDSAKGRQLRANPRAALLFHWKSLHRQVRARGTVFQVSDDEADAYFATRARASQLGAWASEQSRPMEEPLALEKAVARFGVKFGLGAVPRPPHWSGFRLEPLVMEFWRSRRFRLHERLVFAREDPSQAWRTARLYP